MPAVEEIRVVDNLAVPLEVEDRRELFVLVQLSRPILGKGWFFLALRVFLLLASSVCLPVIEPRHAYYIVGQVLLFGDD